MRQIAKASRLFHVKASRLFQVAFVSTVLVAVVGAFVVAGFSQRSRSSAAKKEYFTEDELDLIRDAQELSARVPAYFKLAERRLIFLGIMEKSAQQIEKERKEREKRAKEARKGTDNKANANKPP